MISLLNCTDNHNAITYIVQNRIAVFLIAVVLSIAFS